MQSSNINTPSFRNINLKGQNAMIVYFLILLIFIALCVIYRQTIAWIANSIFNSKTNVEQGNKKQKETPKDENGSNGGENEVTVNEKEIRDLLDHMATMVSPSQNNGNGSSSSHPPNQ